MLESHFSFTTSKTMFQVNIQFLRAVAAFMVFIFHLAPHIGQDGHLVSGLVIFLRQFGYAGVDIFFVISGFVIWVSSQSYINKSQAQFVYNRMSRIYLGYWPYFIIFFGLLLYFTPQRIEPVNMISSFFLVPEILPNLLLQVSWTLTYELYFYLFFTLLLFVPQSKRLLILISLFVLIIFLQGYQIIVNDIYSVEKLVFMDFYLAFLSSPFCLEFLMGSLLAIYFEKFRIKYIGILSIIAVLIFYSAIWYQKEFIPNGLLSQGYYLPQRVLFFGTFAVMLVGIFVELNKRGFVIFRTASKLLGGSSYSLYLAHIPIIFVFSQTGLFQHINKSFWHKELITLLVLFIVFAYSIAHYLYIEKPLMKGSKTLWNTFHKQ